MDETVYLMILFALTFFLFSNATAQQNYSGNSIMSCSNNDTKGGPSPAFLYTCNGPTKSCPAFLLFKSQPPHDSAAAISNLTSSKPQDIARVNNASVFPKGKEVIVPVNCSCPMHDQYYRSLTTYVLPQNPTYFTAANETFQGLTTCDSLRRFNPYGVLDLHPGMVLHVPLRCACPTKSQIRNGTKYLLTYSVNWRDNITNIAARFNVTASSLAFANGFSSETESLFPFTTVLIPLRSEPNSSITRVQNYTIANQNDKPIGSKKDETKRKGPIIGVASSGGLVLVLCVVLAVLRKKSEGFFKRGTKARTKVVSSAADIREEIASIENLSKVYRFREIREATENFSARSRIKGSVYRGKGKEVLAIKKMSADASKEVKLLGKINHFNLIKLQGYCKHDGLFYLVFEYMESGSLREWLGKNSCTTEHQSWGKRVQIALDIANGLQYLHNFTEPCYVHKDISTDNILLNRDLRAKIANFTLAQESDGELTSRSSSTLKLVGTRGYMAPEYLAAGIVTSKVDVYAFGVVLLELITGKDSIVVQDDGREAMLSSIMVNMIDRDDDAEEKLGFFIDPSLMGSGGTVFALHLVKLSLACLVEEPASRPNMAEVVSRLMKIHTEMDRRMLPCIKDSASLER